MISFIILTCCIGLLYVLMIIFFVRGWAKIPVFEHITGVQEKSIRCSVVIAARNEEGNIENLLSDVLQQEYSATNFEIIVVNDHSTDRTREVVEFFQQGSSVTLLDLPSYLQGKKNAIAHGIKYATGVLVVTVDADCRVGKRWISTIVSYYEKHKASLIIGPVDLMAETSLWSKFQNLEFLSLMGVTAGAAGAGRPFICNGANIAFERALIKRMSDPFSVNITSGDDVFLLHAMKKIPGIKIGYIKCRDALVYTRGCATLGSFIQQRARWGAKTKMYTDTDAILFSLVVMITNIYFVALLILSFFNISFLFFFLCLLLVKTLTDTLLFSSVLPFFEKRGLAKHIFMAELLYTFYLVLVALASMTTKQVWKGRKVEV